MQVEEAVQALSEDSNEDLLEDSSVQPLDSGDYTGVNMNMSLGESRAEDNTQDNLDLLQQHGSSDSGSGSSSINSQGAPSDPSVSRVSPPEDSLDLAEHNLSWNAENTTTLEEVSNYSHQAEDQEVDNKFSQMGYDDSNVPSSPSRNKFRFVQQDVLASGPKENEFLSKQTTS